MLYHNMPTQVFTCPTSFHQLYSITKSAAVELAQSAITTRIPRTIKLRICEGRIRRSYQGRATARFDAEQRRLRPCSLLVDVGRPRSYHRPHAEQELCPRSRCAAME